MPPKRSVDTNSANKTNRERENYQNDSSELKKQRIGRNYQGGNQEHHHKKQHYQQHQRQYQQQHYHHHEKPVFDENKITLPPEFVYARDAYSPQEILKECDSFAINFEIIFEEQRTPLSKSIYSSVVKQQDSLPPQYKQHLPVPQSCSNNNFVLIKHHDNSNSKGVFSDFIFEDERITVRSLPTTNALDAASAVVSNNKSTTDLKSLYKLLWERKHHARLNLNSKIETYHEFQYDFSHLVMQHFQQEKSPLLHHPRFNSFQLPIPIALSLYRIFKPRNVIDLYGRFGEAMIAATMFPSMNSYVACSTLGAVEKYQQVLELFKKKQQQQEEEKVSPLQVFNNSTQYKVLNKKASTLVPNEDLINVNNIDFIICNPFTCVELNMPVQTWFNEIKQDIKKTWQTLRIGGFMLVTAHDYLFSEQASSNSSSSSSSGNSSGNNGDNNNNAEENLVKPFIEPFAQNLSTFHCTDALHCFIMSELEHASYFGLIKYGDPQSNSSLVKPLYIYHKLPSNKELIPSSLYDRELIIQDVQFNKKTFHIIREDLLIGGSKQRVGYPFLSKVASDHIFYRGPANGYAQVALAYTCKMLGKTCHMILNKQDSQRYDVTFIAMIFGAQIHEVKKAHNQEQEEKQAAEIKNIMGKYPNAINLPLGLYDESTVHQYTVSQLATVKEHKPKRLWITVSSCVILHAFYRILLDCYFNVVMVGDKHHEKVDKSKSQVFEAPERFRQTAVKQPPYPAERSYDAKMWQFIQEHGQDGDFVLNVAGLEKHPHDYKSVKAYY